MTSLHIEVIASILAAGLLGLGCGWMIGRTVGARRLRDAVTGWETRYAKLERESAADVDRLESSIETLGAEMRALVARDRDAEDRLARSEAGAHKAQSDIIELNRRQAETQERLQQIIRRKDREIASLEARLSGERDGAAAPGESAVPMVTRAAGSRPSTPAATPAKPTTPVPVRAVRPRPVPVTPPGEVGGAPRRETGPAPRSGKAHAAPARTGAPAAGTSSRATAPPDDPMDATELVDETDVVHLVDVDETVDDTVVAAVPARAARREVETTADDTLSDDLGTMLMGDDPLDSTGDSTVVLDEAQLRAARAARRRVR